MAIFGIKYREIGDFRLEFGIWHFSIFIPPPFPGKFGIFRPGKTGQGGGIIWHLAFWPGPVLQGLAHLCVHHTWASISYPGNLDFRI